MALKVELLFRPSTSSTACFLVMVPAGTLQSAAANSSVEKWASSQGSRCDLRKTPPANSRRKSELSAAPAMGGESTTSR